MNLQNKTAILTGASSGIGLDLLNLLLQAGVTVVAASRTMEKANVDHPLLLKINCDVSSKDSLDALFAYALEQMGAIDLFIANAGFAYYEKQARPDWEKSEKIFATNVLGLFYCAQKMKAINGEAPYNFVCTASAMSFLSIPGYALYSSTKAAIRGFADAYRFELNEGQHFQVAFPVSTKTNFFQVAGDSPPVPWPTQSSGSVARAIIRGISSNHQEIFPSRLFRAIMIIDRYLPIIFPLYRHNANRNFQHWLQKQSGDGS